MKNTPGGTRKPLKLNKPSILLARPKGFEPLTSAFGGQSPTLAAVCSSLTVIAKYPQNQGFLLDDRFLTL
jgi:hypothetical protein